MTEREKVREEIAKMLDEIRDEYCLSDHESRLVYSDRILSLLAPVIEKAAFLDDITKRTDDKDCYENGWCPLSDTCDGKLWCRHIKEALEAPDGN